jgi:hypothetical protein
MPDRFKRIEMYRIFSLIQRINPKQSEFANLIIKYQLQNRQFNNFVHFGVILLYYVCAQ